ncbi:MAG: GWxTD domain-containing protein [Candidatus Aminicenantia bacterium]
MRKILLLILSSMILYGYSAKELPPKYRKWLEEEVVYIITQKEREIFLQLQSDKERDLFIEAFWAVRDPTPGTPQNEFKDEHYRRIEYANKYFGKESPRPGWMTDRGRVYIILGEPIDKEIHEGSPDVTDTEIWFYKGDVKKGFPSFFYVVFFRREGTGEYVLYSPLKDGPESLFIDSKMRLWDRKQVLDHLREIGGQLADVSLSLIPGESVSRDGSSILLSSDALLGKINDYQRNRVKDDYAEKLLKYKEIVEIDYSVNYVESSSDIFLIRDSRGNYFIHYQIEPKRLSLDSYQNNYYTSLKIYGKIQNLYEQNIFQFEKSISIELKENELNSIKNKPFAIVDLFPIIPGNYIVSILVKNVVSKEFFSIERQISVPYINESPILSPILLYYEKKPSPFSNFMKPFSFEGEFYLVAINGVFSPSDNLGVFCKANNLPKISIKSLEWKIEILNDGKTILSKSFSFSQFPLNPSMKNENIDQELITQIPLSELKPGNYELKVSIYEKGQEILSEKRDFSVSPTTSVPRAWTVSKPTFTIDDPLIDFSIGVQHLNNGELDQAISRLERARGKKPDSIDFSIALSKAFLTKRDWEKVIETLKPFLKTELKSFEPFYFTAKAYHNLKEYSSAIYNYRIALNIKGLDPEILNSIGDCYLKLGDNSSAIKAFGKSLEINPSQRKISEILKKLRGGEK